MRGPDLEKISQDDRPDVFRVTVAEQQEEVHYNLRKKLVDRAELPEIGAFAKRRGLTTSFTTGTYDMIHVGHGRYIQVCKSLGDICVVGLNSDKSVKEYKDPTRPILTEVRRAEMLAYLASVDYISLFDETTGDGLIRLLKPDTYLLVEGSWKAGTDIEDKEEVKAMREHGGRVVVSPRQDPLLSTTDIIKKLEGHGEVRGRAAVLDALRGIVNREEQQIDPALIRSL